MDNQSQNKVDNNREDTDSYDDNEINFLNNIL